MYRLLRSKKAVLFFTIISLLLSWSELLWLRNVGSDVYRFEKWQFGLLTLPWISATIGFLLLVYMRLFKPEVPKTTLKTVLFGLLTVSFLFVWCGILVGFVF